MISTEEVYILYQNAKGFWSKNKYIPKVSEWDLNKIKGKAKSGWEHFETLTGYLNSNPSIDAETLINSVFYGKKCEADVANEGKPEEKHVTKQVYPRMFSYTSSLMKHYSDYVDWQNTNSVDYQVNLIEKSFQFIKSYMKEKGMTDVHDYFTENLSVFPTFVLHLRKGVLSYYILSDYHRSDEVMQKVPRDIREEFLIKYLQQRKMIRLRTVRVSEIQEKLDEIFEKLEELQYVN